MIPLKAICVSCVHSPYKISDHDTVAFGLNVTRQVKYQTKRKCILYSKGDSDTMRKEAKVFANEKYFNGLQNQHSMEGNWCMLTFIKDSIEKKYSN